MFSLMKEEGNFIAKRQTKQMSLEQMDGGDWRRPLQQRFI